MSERQLADTSVVIWTLEASPRLSARAKRALFDPAVTLMVSVVSVWEIILKYQARKLLLATTLSLIQYKMSLKRRFVSNTR